MSSTSQRVLRMAPSKITGSLFLGIAGTIGFNLSPIVFGYGMKMNSCFILYAGIMLILSFTDRRVLGYATVLSACNPANSLANLSFSFLLALLTILRESPVTGQVVRELNKQRWWWLFLAAFLLVGLSVPFWPLNVRAMVSEVKQVCSRLGYLAVLPLAVALTIRTPRDGVRVVSLLCLMSVAVLVVFFFRGQSGAVEISAVAGEDAIGVEKHIGSISLNFLRTQVCILLAALAVGSLALGVGNGVNFRAMPFYLASCVCVFMIMILASVGSVCAMVGGMGIVALGYFGVHLSAGRIALGIVVFATVGSTMYWAIFRTENALSTRITEKIEYGQIDRWPRWVDGVNEISKTPFGEGWSYRTGHSDWLLFLLSYGWLTGLLYIAAAGSLLLSMWRELRRRSDAIDYQSSALCLVGLGVLAVYIANSILDMLSANIGYYQTVWALILTSATVVAVTDAVRRTTSCNKSAFLSLNSKCYGA